MSQEKKRQVTYRHRAIEITVDYSIEMFKPRRTRNINSDFRKITMNYNTGNFPKYYISHMNVQMQRIYLITVAYTYEN